ncbi:hypothetical protein F4V43_02320 [Paenibacillus spiritus]|uniref:Uncharacterized protein n=1 Tax=Paenibacillus spiritus TaxID=2496557 RepID=A0A5J5GGQ6_9BACL|nr:hypothetical protein [Paenibacillus spiritus]KAA9007341.1 hypothetical protein F4V43_02320 [Paenibacillus spiritus]
MKKARVESLIRLCNMYYNNRDNGTFDEAQKKYMALEVIDAFNSGELQKMLEDIKDKEPSEYGFMDNQGDLKLAKFTPEQIRYGELRAHIEYMKEEGYHFMGMSS